jgi:hypothetical protein
MTDVANTGDGENRLRPRSQPNQEVVRAAPRLTGCVLHQRRLPDARVATEYRHAVLGGAHVPQHAVEQAAFSVAINQLHRISMVAPRAGRLARMADLGRPNPRMLFALTALT